MPSTIPDFVLQLTTGAGAGCGGGGRGSSSSSSSASDVLAPIEAALNGIDARLTDEQQRELLRVHLNPILVGCVAALESLYKGESGGNALVEDSNHHSNPNNNKEKCLKTLKRCCRTISRLLRSPEFAHHLTLDTLTRWVLAVAPLSNNKEKCLKTLKRCCRTISRLLRSPEFAHHLTLDTLTRWVLAVAPLSNNKEHLMEVLESKSLLLNALDRSLLFRALLAACKAQLARSLPARSGFGFLVKQLSKLVKRLELTLRMWFDNQADPNAERSSEFSELALAPILKEVDELLVAATEKKRFPSRYAEVVAALVEELESLLHLLAVYAEIRGASIRNYFHLVPKGTESVSFRYVTEHIVGGGGGNNKENEGPETAAATEADSLVFIEKPEPEDFETVDAEGEVVEGGEGEEEEEGAGDKSAIAIDIDWIVVDETTKIPDDLSELELD